MLFTVWKPFGVTSNTFIEKLRYDMTAKGNMIKRICYAGRLDPLAQGTMLILTDDDVSDMNTYLKHDKTYEFSIIIGIETSSHDVAGTILHTKTCNLSDKELIESLHTFAQSYTVQSYPAISSYVVRQDTYKKPLWWFAKNNIRVRNVPSKNVTIHTYDIQSCEHVQARDFYNDALDRISLITNPKTKRELDVDGLLAQYESYIHPTHSVQHTFVNVKMKMDVSSGFYIRQFCADFGAYIGMPCIAFDITRCNIYTHIQRQSL
jgi:tRNA pseudouridine(55) synthase